jgi:cell division protein FtsB
MEQEKKKNISWISILINKYTVLIFFFLVYVTFFDEHNLIKRFKNLNEIGKLNSELDIYQKKIQDDRDEIYKLLNDTEYLEKYAREKYFMRRPDEDVFIFRDSIQTEEK